MGRIVLDDEQLEEIFGVIGEFIGDVMDSHKIRYSTTRTADDMACVVAEDLHNDLQYGSVLILPKGARRELERGILRILKQRNDTSFVQTTKKEDEYGRVSNSVQS